MQPKPRTYWNKASRHFSYSLSNGVRTIRPIVRGKAKAAVEFGAKIAMSVVDGYSRVEQVQWYAFNEGQKLKEAVEVYRIRYGCYPEAVLADKLYRTRENLQYCRGLGIRLSGPKLGRPVKGQPSKNQRRLERQA